MSSTSIPSRKIAPRAARACGDQHQQRGLPRPGVADNRDRLAGLYDKRYVVQFIGAAPG
jgi:hypothetical protein